MKDAKERKEKKMQQDALESLKAMGFAQEDQVLLDILKVSCWHTLVCSMLCQMFRSLQERSWNVVARFAGCLFLALLVLSCTAAPSS